MPLQPIVLRFFSIVSIKYNASFFDLYFNLNPSKIKLNIAYCAGFLKRPRVRAGVDMGLKVFDERNIGKLYCLWESIHAYADFEKYSVVNKELLNLVFINEIFGGDSSWLSHVFVLIYIGVEVKGVIFQA